MLSSLSFKTNLGCMKVSVSVCENVFVRTFELFKFFPQFLSLSLSLHRWWFNI